MENKLSRPNQTVFEQIKLLDKNKNEYWTARDLSSVWNIPNSAISNL
jgi:hypothetical protein